MPKLTIDNREIEVPEGTKVIEAAERLGIYIPRFCFHEALGAVGACRVCAVKFLEGPVSGVEMSCMVAAEDGMKVSTTNAEAVDFRRHVIEWLMINHPHDCPVCDEGGHCLLQDLTVAGGHGIRRFSGRKRTYPDQYLGPLVQHEMNRCIHCYRCVRFYRQYAGYPDLGVTGIAGRTWFGRLRPGVLQSPFSGNLIDICPTGVYTDKPSRYTGRRWDFERTPGLCIHCSLGCRVTVSALNRQIVRLEARFSPDVNGHFICDRGRYGFYYADRPKRPRTGRIGAKEASAPGALQQAAARLRRAAELFGAQAVAVIGSGRSSLETQAALAWLCSETGWQGPVFRDRRMTGEAVAAAVCALSPQNAVCMREIESADAILAVGADPVNEAPMLALAMRQARRAGADVIALDPRPLAWPMDFTRIACAPSQMADALESAAAPLARARRPVVVCGTEITDARTVRAAAAQVGTLGRAGGNAGWFCILPQANSFGAALLDRHGRSAGDILESIGSGEIRALAVFESDLWECFPDRRRLESALAKLDLLVVFDFMDHGLYRLADICVPTLTVFEAGGIYVNQEGRAQAVGPAHAGGLPVSVEGRGGHPPRTFRPGIPGRDMPAAWAAAFALAGRQAPEDQAQMRRWMAGRFPELAALASMGENGVRLFAAGGADSPRQPRHGKEPGKQVFEVLCAAAVFGDEPMSLCSPCLRELAGSPAVWISRADAEKLGISDRDRLILALDAGEVELEARVSDDTAAGVLVLYRHPGIEWQRFLGEGGFRLDADRLRVAGRD